MTEAFRRTLAEGLEIVADRIDRAALRHQRHAAPESELLEEIGLPASTYAAEKAAGRGPRTFKIGRRIYVRIADWHAWLDERAGAGGSAA